MPSLFERELILGALIPGEINPQSGQLEEAEHWSARAQRTLNGHSDAGMLRPRAERLRLVLQERMLGQAVTPAEQRVLDLLPAQQSVNDIGARPFLTRPDDGPPKLAAGQARCARADGGRRASAAAWLAKADR